MYVHTQADEYDEQTYKNACLTYPYNEEDMRIFGQWEDTPEQVLAENFLMWLQVNQ